jgi:hypothetical protein
LAGPDVRRGADVYRHYSLYSLLKTLQRFFDVPYLRNARCSCTNLMNDMFLGRRIRRWRAGT